MTFSFHPEAETEFLEAINYYEDRERGLGYDFSIEVFATIQNIIIYPTAWPIIGEGTRRCLVGCQSRRRFTFLFLHLHSLSVFYPPPKSDLKDF